MLKGRTAKLAKGLLIGSEKSTAGVDNKSAWQLSSHAMLTGQHCLAPSVHLCPLQYHVAEQYW